MAHHVPSSQDGARQWRCNRINPGDDEAAARDAVSKLGIGVDGPTAASAWKRQDDIVSRHGASLHLAAISGDAGSGRISIYLNRRLSTPERVAYFGLLGLPDSDPDGCLTALLSEAEAWCRQAGVETIRGPIACSTWYPNRCVLTETMADRFPGDSPYPSSLVAPLERAGFRVTNHYFSALTRSLEKFTSRLAPVARYARSRGVLFSPVEGPGISALLGEAYELADNAFAANFSFTRIEREEFELLYAGAPRLPEAIVIAARDAAGKLLGFAFGHVAPGFSISASPGAKVGVLKTIAIDPGASDLMLGPALSAELHATFLGRGCEQVIHALMARDRYALGEKTGLVDIFRTYGIFEKEVAP